MIKPLTRPTQTFDLLTSDQETCHRFLQIIKGKTIEALLDGQSDNAKKFMDLYDDVAEFAREVMEE